MAPPLRLRLIKRMRVHSEFRHSGCEGAEGAEGAEKSAMPTSDPLRLFQVPAGERLHLYSSIPSTLPSAPTRVRRKSVTAIRKMRSLVVDVIAALAVVRLVSAGDSVGDGSG